MINITLPDGSVRQYEAGVTSMQVAESISSGLARNVLSAKVNGEVWDANRPINNDSLVQLLTWKDKDGKMTFWHSTAHLLAEAVEALYPGVKFGTGPAINDGYYYDIDPGEHKISESDFKKIEDKMIELARQKNQFVRQDITKADALKYFTDKGDEYKLELIEKRGADEALTLYTQGNFIDLCRGPHVPHTGVIKAVKIMKVGGAFWQGDESRQQMVRLRGVAFPKAKELKQYLVMLEEAKKRDHRKIGQEMDLFMFSEKVGAGLPIWLPKGNAVRDRLMKFMQDEQVKRGYKLVTTPHIGKKDLYVTSGHYAKYGEDSFQPIKTPKTDEEFLLKPMNCPHHCEVYAHRPHSYRELPLRIAEFGTVYRYEQTGELHGLSRVRGFTQDDAHIFCTEAQLKDEFLNVLDLTETVLKKMGFKDYTAQISLRDPSKPEKYIGSDENWRNAESAIIPVMIHRAPFGSLERFMSVLIEHTAGKFPLWLTPEQFVVLPVSDKYNGYANGLVTHLANHDIRGFVDDRNESIGRKIRDNELKKIPLLLIVGEKEADGGGVGVRVQGEGDKGFMKLDEFVQFFQTQLEAEDKKEEVEAE